MLEAPVPVHTACAVRRVSPAQHPLALFERLRRDAYPWLLDSALPSARLGRHSFAGADPYLVARARGARVELECRRGVYPGLAPGRRTLEGDPFEWIRRLLPAPPDPDPAVPLPFVGGAVALLGYELAEHLERLALRAPDDLALPELVLLCVDRLLAYDHEEDSLHGCALGFGASSAEARGRAEAGLETWLRRLRAPGPPARAPWRARAGAGGLGELARFDEASYAKAVEAALEEIAAGNLYQACLTQRIEREFAGDPWALYRRLRRANPAPFASYVELPELALAGSSPERFLRLDAGGRVESRPIKGTRPRGRHPAEDERNRLALAGSQKDRAENLMIVDLVRNDLGRVCETGSVRVPELMAIEAYATVFQMVSTVRGRLRPDRDAVDLLRAAFPPGSMTGAPKIAAMRALDRLEPVRRGFYAGALGYLDVRGGADLCVVIRTALVCGGRAYVHCGGGVVADSDPVAEYRESLDKAAPLLGSLDAFRP